MAVWKWCSGHAIERIAVLLSCDIISDLAEPNSLALTSCVHPHMAGSIDVQTGRSMAVVSAVMPFELPAWVDRLW